MAFFNIYNPQKIKTALRYCNLLRFSHRFSLKLTLLLLVHLLQAHQAHQQAVYHQPVCHIHGLKISEFPGT